MIKQLMKKSLACAFLLGLCLAGCSGGGTAEQKGGFQAVIETTPQQPITNQETAFKVTVTEPDQDAKMEKAKVSLFLEMTEMDHGENRIELTEAEPGVYQGNGKFPMPGNWLGHVRAEKDGKTHTTNVNLKVE